MQISSDVVERVGAASALLPSDGANGVSDAPPAAPASRAGQQSPPPLLPIASESEVTFAAVADDSLGVCLEDAAPAWEAHDHDPERAPTPTARV